MMDEKSQSRQYWLRVMLALGILWGGWLPIQLFESALTPGSLGPPLNILAAIVNSITLAPACILAFWHRRAASVWLSLNGILMAATMTRSILRNHRYDPVSIVCDAIPVLLAIFLAVMELRRWPGALDRDQG